MTEETESIVSKANCMASVPLPVSVRIVFCPPLSQA